MPTQRGTFLRASCFGPPVITISPSCGCSLHIAKSGHPQLVPCGCLGWRLGCKPRAVSESSPLMLAGVVSAGWNQAWDQLRAHVVFDPLPPEQNFSDPRSTRCARRHGTCTSIRGRGTLCDAGTGELQLVLQRSWRLAWSLHVHRTASRIPNYLISSLPCRIPFPDARL